MPLQLDSEYARPQTIVHNSSVYPFNNNNIKLLDKDDNIFKIFNIEKDELKYYINLI
jgi:hypothetical protein